MKVYVRDYSKRNVDGERLQVVKTYESKPHRFDYIFWLDDESKEGDRLLMKLICSYCGRDINELGQDNMSEDLFTNECEDCAGLHDKRQKENSK